MYKITTLMDADNQSKCENEIDDFTHMALSGIYIGKKVKLCIETNDDELHILYEERDADEV